jgi:hypothetical protein
MVFRFSEVSVIREGRFEGHGNLVRVDLSTHSRSSRLAVADPLAQTFFDLRLTGRMLAFQCLASWRPRSKSSRAMRSFSEGVSELDSATSSFYPAVIVLVSGSV